MPTAEKAQVIQQAQEWYSKASGIVFTDYRGLSVKEIQVLRKDLRKKGAEIHVLKNTLFRIAAGEDVNKIPAEHHNGTTAIAFIFEDEAGCAKALVDFAKSSKKLVVKGGFFGGKSFDAKQVEQLADLPPREVLIAQVIGAIAAPLSNLVGVIEALYADPIRVIGAVADKVAEGSPLPEKTEAPAAEEETVVTEVTEASAEVAPEPEAETSTPTE